MQMRLEITGFWYEMFLYIKEIRRDCFKLLLWMIEKSLTNRKEKKENQ